MLGKSFFVGEVFNQLDHFEALSRRELQESTEQAEAFDSAACRHTELQVQLGREIEVFHLAPMTSSGFRDSRTERRNRPRCDEFPARGRRLHAEWEPDDGSI